MKIYKATENGCLTIGNMTIPQDHRLYTLALEEVEAGESDILPYVEPLAPIPQVVTMRQARLALLSDGLLANVETALASLSEPDKSAASIEWEYSQTVERQRPFVLTLGALLGLTSIELDDLFILASTL